MQILIGPRRRTPDLAPWQQRDLWENRATRDPRRVRENAYEAVVGREPPGPPLENGLQRQLAAEVMAYRAFPATLVTPRLARAPVEQGDTVGTQYHLAPRIDLFFASRVVEVFDKEDEGSWRTGFIYSTIIGHPVMGAETFCVEKNLETGEVTVALRSWSQPITPLARCFAWPCRKLQAQAGRAAITRLRQFADEISAANVSTAAKR